MSRTNQRRAAVFRLYQRDLAAGERERQDALGDFALELVEGVESHRDELDAAIARAAIDWSVERIAPLERAILRTALFEMLHRPDVPAEVAIDEAVELAKQYCGAQAPGFVNGILGNVMKEGKIT